MTSTALGRRPAADREFGDYVAARRPGLLHFARLLCGDPARAGELTDDALATAYRHWPRARRSADAYVRKAVLRRFLSRGGGAGEGPDGLSPRARALLVLRDVEGLPEAEIAELLDSSSRRAHASYPAARATLGERAPGVPIEQALLGPDRPEPQDEQGDPLAAVYDRARIQRRTGRRRAVAVLGVLALLGGVSAVVHLVRPAHDQVSVPVARGLLDWPTRGALATDPDLLRATTRVWEAEATRLHGVAPASDVRALYAGRLGTGRFAVLEGLDAGRAAWVAVVAEHGPKGEVHLTLDAVGRLPARLPPVLVFGYDGNLNVPWLEPAPPSAYYQALVSPRVTRLEQRVFGLKRPDPYPTGFRRLELTGGLSQSWLSVPTGTRGSLRAYRGGSLVFEGVMPLTGPVPQPVTVTVGPPPLPALGARVSDSQQRTDGLLFAERMGACPVTVSTLWAGLLPDAVPARLLAARCGARYATALAVGRDDRSELGEPRPQRLGLRGIDVVASRASAASSRSATPYVVAVARSAGTRLVLSIAGRTVAESGTGVLVAALPPAPSACPCPAAELRAFDPAGRRLAVGGGVT